MSLLQSPGCPIEKHGVALIAFTCSSTLAAFLTERFAKIALPSALELNYSTTRQSILTRIFRLLQVVQPFDFPGIPTMAKPVLFKSEHNVQTTKVESLGLVPRRSQSPI